MNDQPETKVRPKVTLIRVQRKDGLWLNFFRVHGPTATTTELKTSNFADKAMWVTFEDDATLFSSRTLIEEALLTTNTPHEDVVHYIWETGMVGIGLPYLRRVSEGKPGLP